MDIEPNSPPTPPPQFGQAPSYDPPSKKKMPVWAILLIIFGLCGCGCVPVLAAILYPVFAQAKIAGKSSAAMVNMKELSVSHFLYMADSDDRAMPADNWHERLSEYRKSPGELDDPLLASEVEKRGFGYNAGVQKVIFGEIEDPESVPMFGLTSQPGQDALVSVETLRPISKGSEPKSLVSFCGGGTRRVLVEDSGGLQWKPVLRKE